MLLPLLMEIETDGAMQKKEATSEMNIKDYIYIEKNGEILRLKVTFDHMSIVDALEKYIANCNTFNFEVQSEEQAKRNYDLSTKYFPYLGKFRLEDSFFKTDNYYVPEKTELLKFLINAYNAKTVTQNLLKDLCVCCEDALSDKEITHQEILDNMILKMSVEVEDSYTMDEIDTTINFVNKFQNEVGLNTTLRKIKWILNQTKDNGKFISELGLQNKIEEAVNTKKKVK